MAAKSLLWQSTAPRCAREWQLSDKEKRAYDASNRHAQRSPPSPSRPDHSQRPFESLDSFPKPLVSPASVSLHLPLFRWTARKGQLWSLSKPNLLLLQPGPQSRR